MEVLIIIVCIVAGLLNLILFFKIWGMTDNVREIKDIIQMEYKRKNESVIINEIKDGLADINKNRWANSVTDAEMLEANGLIDAMKANQVIAFVRSKGRMEIWSSDFWDKEKDNPDYKLIYINSIKGIAGANER
jgi:hypothetical protein